MRVIAPQFELQLPGESFTLIGQQSHATRCATCGRSAFLVSGSCAPCTDQAAQDLIQSEAAQATFFGGEA